jgi:hypothetical protein
MAPPRPEPRRNERWKIRKPTIGTRQAMNTLAVPEPGSTLGPSLARIVPGNLCDSVDRAQPGKVVRLEHDPARPQRRNAATAASMSSTSNAICGCSPDGEALRRKTDSNSRLRQHSSHSYPAVGATNARRPGSVRSGSRHADEYARPECRSRHHADAFANRVVELDERFRTRYDPSRKSSSATSRRRT